MRHASHDLPSGTTLPRSQIADLMAIEIKKGRGHRWVLMGGTFDWEVWECKRCFRIEIPSPFGFMWSDLGAWLGFRQGMCPHYVRPRPYPREKATRRGR